jgi:hypothetical protein
MRGASSGLILRTVSWIALSATAPAKPLPSTDMTFDDVEVVMYAWPHRIAARRSDERRIVLVYKTWP